MSWFGGVVLDWFKSYLAHSSSSIKTCAILSEAKKLLYNVLEDSVPGPTLLSQ